MKMTKNYNNIYLKNNINNSNKKSRAEYIYIKKDKTGQKKEVKFITKYISTIDIPYAKYTLKWAGFRYKRGEQNCFLI